MELIVKTPNLTELGEGKHTITLEVTGLPTGVHGIVSPETVEINIEKITTKEVPVVEGRCFKYWKWLSSRRRSKLHQQL